MAGVVPFDALKYLQQMMNPAYGASAQDYVNGHAQMNKAIAEKMLGSPAAPGTSDTISKKINGDTYTAQDMTGGNDINNATVFKNGAELIVPEEEKAKTIRAISGAYLQNLQNKADANKAEQESYQQTAKSLPAGTFPGVAAAMTSHTIPEEEFNQIVGRQTPGMREQYQTMQDIKDLINAPDTKNGQDYLIAGLMGINDILNKTNYAPQVYAEDKNKKQQMIEYKKLLADMQDKYSKQEVEVFKESQKPGLALGKETSLDKLVAKDFNAWNTGGGKVGAMSTLAALDKAITELQNDQNLTGPLAFASNGIINPKGKSLMQLIRKTVVSDLPKKLGSQFTEREGREMFDTAFDPIQPAQYNIEKLLEAKNELQQRILAAEQTFNFYARNNQRMRGFIPGVGENSPTENSIAPPKIPAKGTPEYAKFLEWKNKKGHK